MFHHYTHRLEENVSTKETLLLTEREQNASTSKLLAEEQLKIAELIKNIEEAHRKSDSLQTTIERSDSVLLSMLRCVFTRVLVAGVGKSEAKRS